MIALPKRLALLGAALVAAALCATSSSAGVRFVDFAGSGQFTSETSGTVSPGATSIPTWSSSYVDGLTGGSFAFTIVGRSPMAGASNTIVHTVIIPVDLRFASSGRSLNGSSRTTAVLGSPIFQPASFEGPAYPTQYGNAIHKDMFWTTGGGSPGYNVTLQNDGVSTPLTLEVPKNQGYDQFGATSGIQFGLADYAWLSKQLKPALKQVPPSVLPIFVVSNTFLWQKTPSNCCLLGFHGVLGSKKDVSTYVFASYSDPGLFEPLPGQTQSFVADIHSLSHEISEWYADPFLTNVVVPWRSSLAPQYGCADQLETGDPVIGYGWNLTMPNGITYHPQDEAFLSWFAHESPSRAFGGRYTYLRTFTSPAPTC
jgi:hypothetical protein